MELAKVRSQLVILLQQAPGQYQRARQNLMNMGRDIAYKVQGVGEAIHARKYYLPELRSGCAGVIAATNKGIVKLRPHIFALRRAAALVGQRAQQNLVKSGVAAGYKARQVVAVVYARKYYLPELRRSGAVAFAATSAGIAKGRSHVVVLSERARVHLREARQTLANDKQRLEELLVGKKADFQAGCAAAISAANSGIKKVGSQLCAPLEHGARCVQRAGDKVTSVGREIADRSRRIREARHMRENELRNLLATSVDAIVVTDDEHRFVAANTKALDLFGVSNGNITNFTLDSFISKGQIPGFDGHGSFGRGEVNKGNCKIRRLDGNLRLADYEFTANHLPFRHVCILRNVTCKTIGPIAREAGFQPALRC